MHILITLITHKIRPFSPAEAVAVSRVTGLPVQFRGSQLLIERISRRIEGIKKALGDDPMVIISHGDRATLLNAPEHA